MANLYFLLVGAIAMVVSHVLTGLVSRLAVRWGLVDRPDGHHKKHASAVALGGGLAVFLAAAITFLVEYVSSMRLQNILSQESPFLGGLLLAGAWIVGLGLYDDRFGMKGRYKLVGQLVAAMIVIGSGLQIRSFYAFDHQFDLGYLSIPFTAFWLLGAINSLNLLDGIDGLATTIGIILCAAIAVIAIFIGQTAVAVVAAVFVGSLIGFLKYNFPPATIYLGDAGSMLIGLVVGALAIGGSMKGPATVALAAPVAIWALPIFDSLAAILRRKLTGRSIYATDRGHLHHRLMTLFGNKIRVLAFVSVCCVITCAGALLSTYTRNDYLALGTVAVVLCILIASRAFGHVEFLMLGSRLKWLVFQIFRSKRDHEVSFQMQGTRQWDLLWQSLTECAEKMQLADVRLDINLASIQESYHASWHRARSTERRERWHTVIPLMAGQHLIGRLSIAGCQQAGISNCEAIAQLMDVLEPMEAEIVSLAGNVSPEPETITNAISETAVESSKQVVASR